MQFFSFEKLLYFIKFDNKISIPLFVISSLFNLLKKEKYAFIKFKS